MLNFVFSQKWKRHFRFNPSQYQTVIYISNPKKMQNFNVLFFIYNVPLGVQVSFPLCTLWFLIKILKATHLIYFQDQLWNLSKEKVEEEGECEDGTQVLTSSRDKGRCSRAHRVGTEFSFRLKGNTRDIRDYPQPPSLSCCKRIVFTVLRETRMQYITFNRGGEMGVCTLVLCNLATVLSCINPL